MRELLRDRVRHALASIQLVGGREDSAHKAAFDESALFYSFCFDLGVERSYADVVASLLTAGIAETAVASDDDQIMLADRYQSLHRLVKKKGRLVAVARYFDDELTFRQLGLRAKLFALWLIVGSIPSRLRGAAEGVEPHGSDARRSLAEEIESEFPDVDLAVANAQVPTAAHNAVDRMLYSPTYLAQKPFYRLHLHSLPLRDASSPLGEHSDETSTADVELLIHRSGVAIATIVVHTIQTVSADHLSLLSRSDRAEFRYFDAPESLLRGYVKHHRIRKSDLGGSLLPEVHDGQRWYRFEKPEGEKCSLVDVFDLVQGAVLAHAGKSRNSSWFCLPIMFVDNIRCCKSKEEWLSFHDEELVAVLGGVPTRSGSRLSEVAPDLAKDFSISTDESFFIPGGLALQVNWRFDGPSGDDLFDWFMRSTVVENALLRFWQARCIDATLKVDSASSSTISSNLVLSGLRLEYLEESTFSAQTANEISTHIFDALGGSRTLSAARAKSAQLREVLSARASLNVARRSGRLAAGALLAALMLGLPAISQSIDILKEIVWLRSTYESILGMTGLVLSKSELVVGVFILFLVAAVVIVTVRRTDNLRSSHSDLPTRRRRVGVRWPGAQVSVSLSERRPDDDSA